MELSGLGLRRHGPAAEPELLAVGDSGFRVLTCGLAEHGAQGRSPKLDDAVDGFTTGRSSQWEGVTADGSGRVFILQEHPGHVFVLAPELGRLDDALELEVPGRQAEWSAPGTRTRTRGARRSCSCAAGTSSCSSKRTR